jgi:4-hydroxy-tetrahydrodipicolinate synthase
MLRGIAAAVVSATPMKFASGKEPVKWDGKDSMQQHVTDDRAARFRGVFSVLPTPFTSDGAIDVNSLKKVTDLYIRAGVNGLTALGVTAEVNRLSDRERDLVLDTILEQVNGRVPVVAGASAEGTLTCIEGCRRAVSMRAAAVMISPPRMPKLNSDAIVAHYKSVASAIDLPIVVQDYPPTSGYPVEPMLLLRIAHEVPTARTIKLEDPPTPLKISRILADAGDMKVEILGGLGGAYFFEELLAGASGVMTGFAYPEMLVEVSRLFESGQVEDAANAFYRYTPLLRFEAQESVGLAIRKEVLRRRGALENAAVRSPGPNLSPPTRAALDQVLSWMRTKQKIQWT